MQKKYPDGTPTWLIHKIKELEQYAKNYNPSSCDGNCMLVEQYTDGSSTYYWIHNGGSGVYTQAFDYNGTEVCHWYNSSVGCGQDKKTYVQRIWMESH